MNQSLRQEAVLLSLSVMYTVYIFCVLLLLSAVLHINYCTISLAVFETNVFCVVYVQGD